MNTGEFLSKFFLEFLKKLSIRFSLRVQSFSYINTEINTDCSVCYVLYENDKIYLEDTIFLNLVLVYMVVEEILCI